MKPITSLLVPVFLYLKKLFIWKCFVAYFSPLLIYVKNLLTISFHDLAAVGSLLITGAVAGISYLLDLNYFGVSNLLVLYVLITIGGNTGTGIWKSLKKCKEAKLKAAKLVPGPEYRLQMKLVNRYSLDLNKLLFVFFKVFTFLAYLNFASTFLNEGEGFLDWTSAVAIQTPLGIFWYKEWKSIGDNLQYTLGKKPGIFEVTEWIFEVKFFSQFFNRDQTPKPEI